MSNTLSIIIGTMVMAALVIVAAILLLALNTPSILS